jgi:hypothetical protein
VYYAESIVVLVVDLSSSTCAEVRRERSVLASDPLSIEGPILERDR